MLLPSDRIFFEFIKETHGIELNENDLRQLNQFHFEQETIYNQRLANDSDAVFYDVQNGKVLGVVGFAAVGFFAAPLLGASALTGALIGASIGWRLFNKQKNPSSGQRDNEKVVQNYGFESPSGIPAIGDIVPLIYCSRAINPTGGVRVNGRKAAIRIDTVGNSQYFNAIYILALGQLKSYNENYFKLNGINRYLISNIGFWNRYGTPGQPSVENFNAYSQVRTIGSQNEFGLRFMMRLGGNVNGTVFSVSENQFDTFNYSDYYVCNNQRFRVIDKQDGKLIFITPAINVSKNSPVWVTSYPKIQTSKRCTEVHLNIVGQLWARNKEGELKYHGCAFSLFVDGQFVRRFYVQGRSENNFRYTIQIQGLKLSRHRIEIINEEFIDSPFTVVGENGKFIHTLTGVYLEGREIIIKTEQASYGNPSVDFARKKISPDDKSNICTDRGFPLKIVSINELVYPGDIGHTQFYNYDRMALSSIAVQARDGISGDVDGSFFINEGRIIRNHIKAGTCDQPHPNNDILTDNDAYFPNWGVGVGMILRNLDKQIESSITFRDNFTVVTIDKLWWETGDRYLVYYMDASPYLPDIAIDTLINQYGGMGGTLDNDLIADFFIDYESFCTSRAFCKNNAYFWDWYIDKQQSWKQWIFEQSISCLCYPTEVGNRFGMLPEDPAQSPVALFNASNILEGSYTEEYPQKNNTNFLNVNYRYDDGDGDFIKRSVSIITSYAYNNLETVYPDSLDFDCITNEYQAIKVGKIYLNSRRYQTLVCTFSTFLQGYVLREGNLIIVQHIVTEQSKEMSGFVLQAGTFSSGTQLVKLSVPLQTGLDNRYSASIYRLRNATVQRNLPVTVVESGGSNWLQIQGLNDYLSAPTDDYNGDYVIVGIDTTNRRTFRVSRVEPSEDGSVKVTGVLWTPKIHDDSDLIVLR